jgi:hypothetical protein
MFFALFILLNAVLLVRPEELAPAVEGARLYLIAMVGCIVAGLGPLRDLFTEGRLHKSPITVCVLCFAATAAASSLLNLGANATLEVVVEYGKVVVYYLVATAALSTMNRIRIFLYLLIGLGAFQTGLALLQFHEIIDLPALQQTMQAEFDEGGNIADQYFRLSGCGIFADPNDLSLILASGMPICLYCIFETKGILTRLYGGLLLAFFAYSLVQTRSRGGLLAFGAGLMTLIVCRVGIVRSLPLASLALVGMLAVFGGRQSQIDTGSGTAQERVQVWDVGFTVLRSSPILGIGYGQYAVECYAVAHNTYVHEFVEAGVIGGTWFAAAFFLSLAGLAFPSFRSKDEGETSEGDEAPDEEGAERLRPYIAGFLAAFMTGLVSLSRGYVVFTYTILGVCSAFLHFVYPYDKRSWFEMNLAMMRRVAFIGVVVLVFFRVFVMVCIHRG